MTPTAHKASKTNNFRAFRLMGGDYLKKGLGILKHLLAATRSSHYGSGA